MLFFQASFSFCERTKSLIHSKYQKCFGNNCSKRESCSPETITKYKSKTKLQRSFYVVRFFSYYGNKWRPFFLFFEQICKDESFLHHFIVRKNNNRFQITFQLSLLHTFFQLKLGSSHLDPSTILFWKQIGHPSIDGTTHGPIHLLPNGNYTKYDIQCHQF